MSLQYLRSFVEVFRCLSISEAARNLGLTQPAVSQHILSLESQLDRQLFVRKSRGVAATAFAHELAAQIGDGLDRAEAALSTMKARSPLLSGVVHIAGPAELMAEKVALHLKKLRASGLQVRAHLGGKTSLYKLLIDGQADLAFTASTPSDDRLASQKIGSEILLAVAAPDMVRKIKLSGTLEKALREQPYVAYDTDRPLIRDWCIANNLDIGGSLPAMTAPDIRLLRTLVETGVGWTIIPDYLCNTALKSGSLQVIPAPILSPSNDFYLVWAKSSLRHPRVAFAKTTLLEADYSQTS